MDSLIESVMGDYIPFLLMLLALGFGTRQGTELLKKIFRSFKQEWFKDDISWVAALAVAGLAIYGFDIEMFSNFEGWSGIDPDLLNLVQVFLVSFVGNKIHDKAK